MRIEFILIILLSFVLKNECKSQDDSINISGIVISEVFNRPVENCVIKIKNSDTGTLADSLGKFSFKIAKTNSVRLSIRYFGFDETDTTIYLNDESEIFIRLFLNKNCNKIGIEKADLDIKNEEIKLYTYREFVFSLYPEKQNEIDKKFEEKYNVTYVYYGDAIPASPVCLEIYNTIIFKNLDLKYGNAWQKHVNKEALGLEDYLK